MPREVGWFKAATTLGTGEDRRATGRGNALSFEGPRGKKLV